MFDKLNVKIEALSLSKDAKEIFIDLLSMNQTIHGMLKIVEKDQKNFQKELKNVQ